MKSKLLIAIALILATAQGWATSAVITPSVESLNFGEVEIGYPVTQNFVVTGQNLSDNINLALKGRNTYFYQVTPESITPEAAAAGVTVKVKCLPVSQYIWPVSVVLTSAGADDVDIPLTADPVFPEVMFVNNWTEDFTAYAGQMVTHTGSIRFADAEIPTDPNQPVDRFNSEDDDVMLCAIPGGGNYSLKIEGTDKSHFSARIVKASTIINICTVAISYVPRYCGTHDATLKVTCANAGVPMVTINLHGESTQVLGDLSDNGIIDIDDLSTMIDWLLTGVRNTSICDMNDDGVFNLDDVTTLIDHLLSE
jgi:hypothetical protein